MRTLKGKYLLKSKCFLAVALLLSVSGCARYEWVKTGGDPSTYGKDNFACLQIANMQAPPVYQAYDDTPYNKDSSQVNTTCTKNGNTTSCQTNTVNKQKYFGQPRVVDLNEYKRSDIYGACMGSKGWSYQQVEEKK